MPISPIDGAYYFPQTIESVALQSASVGSPTEGAGREALSIRGLLALQNGGYLSLEVGEPQEAVTFQHFDITTSQNTRSVALQSFEVKGAVPSAHSRMSLTVKPEKTTYVALQSFEVRRLVAESAARMGYSVKGHVAARHRPYSLSVRALTEALGPLTFAVRNVVEYPGVMALDVGAKQYAVTHMGLDVAESDGFLVLADIVGTVFADLGRPHPTLGFYPSQDINARLWVNGVLTPIRSFDYERPKGRLGAKFNATLADAVRTLAPTNASIRFDLVVTVAGQTYIYRLVDSGKITGRSYTIQWSGKGPGDELTISGLDTLADLFSIVPAGRQPIIMFDPNVVKLTDVKTNVRDAITDEKGQPILPILEPQGGGRNLYGKGFSMRTALKRAYTGANGYQFMSRIPPQVAGGMQRVSSLIGGANSRFSRGLGFSNVITNIPDYPVARVDFGLGTSWHDAVQPLVGMFGPIYFVESNILYIIDPYRPLPVGRTPRIIPLSKYVRMSHEQPFRDPYNAVELTFQTRGEDEGDEYGFRTVVEQPEPSEDGKFGDLHYQRTEVTVYKQQKYLLLDPSDVVEEYETSRDEKTYGYIVSPTDPLNINLFTQVAREYTQTFYNLVGLKSGHKKEIYGLISTGPDAQAFPVKVATEACEISWTQHPEDPSQMVQERNFTLYEGLIYQSTEQTEVLNMQTGQKEKAYHRWPVIVAMNSPGIVTDDLTMSSGPYRSITEQLIRTKGVLNVVVKERDLAWSGSTRISYTAPRIGSRAANPYEARSKTILLRDRVSEEAIGPRVPVSASAGELPRVMALELGKRELKFGSINRPPEPQMALPGVDFAIRQGTTVKGEFRDGTLTREMIVEGYGIKGEGLGIAGQHRISMSLQGTELIGTELA